MGNGASVVSADDRDASPAAYLHRDGDPGSVYAYLGELRRRGVGGGEVGYPAARFARVAAGHLDADEAGGSSLGVTNGPESLRPGDLAPFLWVDNGLSGVGRAAGNRHPGRPRVVRSAGAPGSSGGPT